MEEEQRLPAGFRFFPTDEELVTYYLARKAMDATFTSAAIRDVDLYTSDPWHLPCDSSAASTGGGGGGECYFFCRRSSKYPSGARVRRATAGGYWKSTGKDKGVYAAGGGGGLVGTKKTLVFYEGRAPRGEKTSWVMHEYSRAPSTNFIRGAQARTHNLLDIIYSEWVICRVFKKQPPIEHWLEMEQEVETTTTTTTTTVQEHTPNRRRLPPAEAAAAAPPPSGQPWQHTSRRSGDGRAAIDGGNREEEEDEHGLAREESSSPVVISSPSRCTSSPSSRLLNHEHLGASSSDDLPELMEFGDIYGGIAAGGPTDQQASSSNSNSICNFLDEPYYCWNF
uniref:NAC domain-containing protein n=1 Tax=Oryza rufipogon TaxID=4529 RepID=A0A0E0QJE6_ORYRU